MVEGGGRGEACGLILPCLGERRVLGYTLVLDFVGCGKRGVLFMKSSTLWKYLALTENRVGRRRGIIIGVV